MQWSAVSRALLVQPCHFEQEPTLETPLNFPDNGCCVVPVSSQLGALRAVAVFEAITLLRTCKYSRCPINAVWNSVPSTPSLFSHPSDSCGPCRVGFGKVALGGGRGVWLCRGLVGGCWESFCPGCGFLPPGGSRVPPEEDVSAVCAHHLSCTGGLGNNYWERLKKIIIK